MLFSFIGRDNSGKPIKGEIEASSIQEAENLLKGRNIYVIEVKRKFNLSLITKKITLRELVFLLFQLSSLLKSGFTLNNALNVVEENTKNPTTKRILRRIKEDVTTGTHFSTSLMKFRGVFPKILIETVRIGETTGNLDDILLYLANYFTKEEDLRSKIKNAFSYPLIIVSIVIIAIVFLLFTIIPVFTKIYLQAGVELPAPTKMLVYLSNILINYWWLLAAVIILIYVAFNYFKSTKRGLRFIDNLLFRMPTALGKIYRGGIFLRVAITLEILLSSGVLLAESLQLLSRMAGNTLVEEAILKTRESVIKGKNFGPSLKDTKIFPNLFTRMVAVGEEGGNLDSILAEISKHLEREIDYEIRSFLVKLEPTLTLIMGALIAFIALAVYLPFFDIAKLSGR